LQQTLSSLKSSHNAEIERLKTALKEAQFIVETTERALSDVRAQMREKDVLMAADKGALETEAATLRSQVLEDGKKASILASS
jgi:hypothetical protein